MLAPKVFWLLHLGLGIRRQISGEICYFEICYGEICYASKLSIARKR